MRGNPYFRGVNPIIDKKMRSIKYICMLLALVQSIALLAQKNTMESDFYTTHWQATERALKDDLPATALKELSLIRERAGKEQNMPQLCRALFQTMHCQTEISPDSLQPCQEAIRRAMEAECRPAEKAVYQYLLGRCTQDTTLISASLADLRMLAETNATQYMPLLDYQRDSRWVHGDDLLSLFLNSLYFINKEPYIREAQKIYAEKGRWAAYYLLMEELNLTDAELYPIWRKAADEHPEVQKVAPIMQYLARTELPTLSLHSLNENVLYPGQPLTFTATARNLTEATLTLAGKQYKLHFSESAPWEQRTDTLTLTAPAAGVYEAVLRSGHLTDETEVHISAVKPMIFGLPDERCRIALVDAITGRTLKNARLVVRNKKTRKEKTYPAAKDGYIYLTAADTEWQATRDCAFYPQAGTDTFYPALNRWDFRNGSYSESTQAPEPKLDIFIDRHIYRPGQEVHVGVVAYTRHADDYQAQKGRTLRLTLYDSNDQEIHTDTLTTDAFGSANTTLVLPKVCLPGQFNIVVNSIENNGGDAYHSFSVQEYKRPTIELKIDAFTETFEVGDTARVTGALKTYTGIPLADTEVHTAQGDTTRTDAEGRFAFRVKVEPDYGRFWWRQQVEITATASNGESASATAYIPFHWGSRPTEPTPDKHTLPFWHEKKVSEAGDEATLTISSCHKPCQVFLDIVSGKRVVEHRVVEMADSMSYTLKYRKDWGDGAVCHLAFVREGQLHSTSVEVVKPRPNKALTLRWSTFRSDLQPGQQETWTMHVVRPDGTPADALVMARLYDAALDAFADNDWNFILYFDRNLPYSQWSSPNYRMKSLQLAGKLPTFQALHFTNWRNGLFEYYSPYRSSMKMRLGAMPVMAKANVVQETVEVNADCTTIADLSMPTEVSAPKEQTVQVRENFDETAFFMPALRTDAEGKVNLEFRLPESLTTWHFTALAHDREMNYGMLRDTIIARKQLMVEMAAPRFLREGDTTLMPLTLTNLTDKAQECTLTFSINGTTETARVSLAAGERITKHFTIAATMTPEGYSTLRAMLQNTEFSDGEERLVPVLSNKVQVTRSVPYAMTKRGSRTLNISSLWKNLEGAEQVRFTVEQSTNPIWYVVNALPPMLDDRSESATAETARLYALGMADYLRNFLPTLTAQTLAQQKAEQGVLERNADLKQTLLEESPWVMEAKTETERQQRLAELLDETSLTARYAAALAKLRELQLPSGAWSWFKGMEGSAWITTDICTQLTRLNLLTGAHDDLAALVAKAMPWLHKDMAEQVQRMKEYEAKHKAVLPIAEGQYRYLYLCALTSQKTNSAMRYLLEKCEKANHDLTMYGKAGCAVVLAHYGSKKRAEVLLQSLVEHSVSTDEMGRYFDTERALGGYSSYKIPTQTFAIEALERVPVKHKAATPEMLAQLRLWLLQSKRTEMWMTSAASMDAIYALLAGQEDAVSADETGTGYTRETFTDAAHMGQSSLAIENTHNHPLWGAAYVQCLMPADKVESATSGLKVERKIEVSGKGGSTTALKVGDRIKITYTLRAERDMDFVCLRAARAACMEPVRALSGYDWQSRSYRAVRDTRTDYFFEHLPKGTLTFTEEVYIDRAGTFTLVPATVECCYSPEFRATTGSMKVEVK